MSWASKVGSKVNVVDHKTSGVLDNKDQLVDSPNDDQQFTFMIYQYLVNLKSKHFQVFHPDGYQWHRTTLAIRERALQGLYVGYFPEIHPLQVFMVKFPSRHNVGVEITCSFQESKVVLSLIRSSDEDTPHKWDSVSHRGNDYMGLNLLDSLEIKTQQMIPRLANELTRVSEMLTSGKADLLHAKEQQRYQMVVHKKLQTALQKSQEKINRLQLKIQTLSSKDHKFEV